MVLQEEAGNHKLMAEQRSTPRISINDLIKEAKLLEKTTIQLSQKTGCTFLPTTG